MSSDHQVVGDLTLLAMSSSACVYFDQVVGSLLMPTVRGSGLSMVAKLLAEVEELAAKKAKKKASKKKKKKAAAA